MCFLKALEIDVGQDILPHYFMVPVLFFIILSLNLYIIWSPSSVAIKNVILLTPVWLFLLVLFICSHYPAFISVTSVCAMTSSWARNSYHKFIKYQLLLLCTLF